MLKKRTLDPRSKKKCKLRVLLYGLRSIGKRIKRAQVIQIQITFPPSRLDWERRYGRTASALRPPY